MSESVMSQTHASPFGKALTLRGCERTRSAKRSEQARPALWLLAVEPWANIAMPMMPAPRWS